MKRLFYFTLLLFLPLSVEAYIGPGLGMGTIGVVLGTLAAFFLTLIAIVWYPLKRLFKLMFNKGKSSATTDQKTIDPS